MGGGEAVIVAGVGFRSGCSARQIADLVWRAQRQAGCVAEVLAAPAFKSLEPALSEAAGMLALSMVFIDQATLQITQPRCPTRSERVAAAVGLASVAEACALAAAGATSRIILPRIAAAGATCALASGEPS